MKKKERFSLRKYKIGTVSVLLGAFFFVSATQQVRADEVTEAAAVVMQADAELPAVTLPSAVEGPSAAIVGDDTSVQAQQTGSESPQNIDSNTIITVPETWDTGYKGEGMIVAVIDSGLDVAHDALRLTDISKAKYKSEDEMKQAMADAGITYGKWYNDKVVFGYNYVDVNNELKEADKSSHGMHVTGIATGNPSQPVDGELIVGVAPEAQVMFMRVFSDVHSTTGQALYVQAIKDAVKLKADAINLSLGGANGSLVNVGEALIDAIEMARRAGVSVVIAAGNDGTFGSGHTNPLVTNPDYGLVGSPSTARDSISVASYNNSTRMSAAVQIIGLEGNAALNNGKSSFTNPYLSANEFEMNKEYDLVFAGLGRVDDFTGLDVAGKVVLIKRGDITFSEKIANAAANGAIGVVVFNHTAGARNVNMSLDETARGIPAIFIPYEFGTALQENPDFKISFKGDMTKTANPEAGKLSDFSSWGLSADGELKPDLSAPGGSIYAAINDNAYEMMDGTSMATPHVAGAAVLIKQYLKATYPGKTSAEYEALVKFLMMSTAKPHVSEETKAYTSPRQQGAGVLDTKAAISTGLYLTGVDNYGSISLGNVGDTFSFEVTVHNITDEDKTLNYVTHVNTDQVDSGLMTLKPLELTKVDGELITVPAKGSKTVRVTVDASAFTADLTTAMPNGYYLEGFVRFVDPVDGGDVVSIPYVGFRGDFQNLPVLETPVYDLLADGKGGVYFTPKPSEAIPGNENFTGLVTETSDVVYSNNNGRADLGLKTLGTFKNNDGIFVLELDKTGVPRFAISPNSDGNQDSLILRGVFLRSYHNLVASVYKADDVSLSTPLWQSVPYGGVKNYFGGDPRNEKSSVIYPTEFMGRDKDGNALEDGLYKYVLSYYPDVVGADKQTMTFDVIIDRRAPEITTATYDKATATFAPRPATDQGPSTILRDRVFYLVRDDYGDASIVDKNPSTGTISIVDNRVYLTKNADGTFTLPLDKADLSDFYYLVEDFAGNVVSAKVADLISIGNDVGLVEVRVIDSEFGEEIGVTHAFSVKDADGNVVTELPRYAKTKNILKLPFGKYTIDLFIYDSERSVLEGERAFTIELTEENSRQTVDFRVKVLTKQMTTVIFDQALPEGSRVTLETADGASLNLPVARYNKLAYGKEIRVGSYTLAVELPAGHEIFEEPVVEVSETGPSVSRFTIINKTDLIAASKEDVVSGHAYYNASLEAKTAYDQALETALAVIANKNSQAIVDQAKQALLDAIAALDGQPTDLSQLAQLVADSQHLVETDAERYRYAAQVDKDDFDKVLAQAVIVLTRADVTQEAVDHALNMLHAANTNLKGEAPKAGNNDESKDKDGGKDKGDTQLPPIAPLPRPVQPVGSTSPVHPLSTPASPISPVATAANPDVLTMVSPIASSKGLPQTNSEEDPALLVLGWSFLTLMLVGYCYKKDVRN